MEKGKLTQNKVHLEDHEYKTVKFFLDRGYDIELIPPSRIKGYHTPDFVMNGLPWEMKAPKGTGKYTVQNTMQIATHQSVNIIIDLRRTKMAESRAINEFKNAFIKSKNVKRMKIITKAEEILDFEK